MTAAVHFLWSVLLSLGLSVTSADVGLPFSTIYSNQDPAVQQRMDFIMVDPVIAAQMGALELTTDAYIYLNGLDPDNPVVNNDIIQESVGIDNWKLFVHQNQNNVSSTVDKNNFSCGEYSFKLGASRYFDGLFWFCYPTVDVYKNGDLYTTLKNFGYSSNMSNAASISLDLYNDYLQNLYYDSTTRCVRHPSNTSIVYDLSPYIDSNLDVESAVESSNIGTAGDYAISSDGSITLPDGTIITPNADGTYTIDGNVYSPLYNLSSYTDPAISSLLSQILQRISDLESMIEFENDLDNSQAEALEDVQAYTGTMQEFLYSSPKWTTVFPFCIPWDFVRGVKILSVDPVAPVINIPFDIPSFGPFNGYYTYITLDFSEYEKYFVPVRWFSTMFFLMSLGFLTFKIVKGAA